MNNTEFENAGVLPLWRVCLDHLREEPSYGYNGQWPVEQFEKELREGRETVAFAFAMLEIKQAIEKDDGYSFKSRSNGREWFIPSAAEHEDESKRLDRKAMRSQVRGVHLRSATLMNDTAELTATERATMERNLEIAANRLVLMARSRSATKVIAEHSPKLLNR